MNFTNQDENIEFLVSLDYHLEEFSDYQCLEWGNLYEELGIYGNNPLIINGDTDFDSNGEYDHHIWNMFAGSTYSSYVIVDHSMVVRYLFDEPNLDNFQNIYLPELVNNMYGCTDIEAMNYSDSYVYSSDSCIYSDVNEDGVTDVNDIISILNMILDSNLQNFGDLNSDSNIDILDIVELLIIILE